MGNNTDGPWSYDDNGAMVFAKGGQMLVADIRGFGHLQAIGGDAIKTMDANGRLIAAAPELLEACESLLEMSVVPNAQSRVIVKKARDAVNKAKRRIDMSKVKPQTEVIAITTGKRQYRED